MMHPWATRPATAADYPAFAQLFPELGVPDLVPTRERWEQDLCHRAVIIEAGGAPVGYGLLAVVGGEGHIINVVIDPAFRGRGAGVALMEAIFAELVARGVTRVYLNVKVDNARAIKLYERFGFRRGHGAATLSFGWEQVSALPRDASAVEARPVEPEEDGAIEAAFHLPHGRLAQFGRQPGQVLYRLVDRAHPDEAKVGVASFDPALRGARIFVVARPALAAPLIEALRPHARPGAPSFSLVIEDDTALVAALRAAGAKVLFELFAMGGEIGRRAPGSPR